MAAQLICRRLPLRPRLGAWIVVAAVALGSLAGVWQASRAHERRFEEHLGDGVDAWMDSMCRRTPGPDVRDRVAHALACSPDVRTAELRGDVDPYRGLTVHVASRGGDLLATTVGSRTHAPQPPEGHEYRLWARDATGRWIDSVVFDPAEPLLVGDRAALRGAVAVSLTAQPRGSTGPAGPVIAAAALGEPGPILDSTSRSPEDEGRPDPAAGGNHQPMPNRPPLTSSTGR